METEHIVRRFEKRGIRPTANRILVLKELSEASHPMSMQELEDVIMTLDKSSIFRALTLFLEHDLVHAIEDGSGSIKYEMCMADGAHSPHDQHVHFYCELCGHTFCLENVPVPMVDLPDGFKAHAVNYIVKGTCDRCREKRL